MYRWMNGFAGFASFSFMNKELFPLMQLQIVAVEVLVFIAGNVFRVHCDTDERRT